MTHKLEAGWINHLRNSSRQDKGKDKAVARDHTIRCPLCAADVVDSLDQFRQHVLTDATKHGSLGDDSAIEDAFRKLTLKPTSSQTQQSSTEPMQSHSTKKRPISGATPDESADLADASFGEEDSNEPESKKICSPPSSDVQQRGSSPKNSTPGRSRARPPPTNEFDRYSQGQRPARQLFNPDVDDTRPKSRGKNAQRQHQTGRARQSQQQAQQSRSDVAEGFRIHVDPERPHTSLVAQPETKPISHEQLVAEVKGIYTGLVMIEAKCIEVDTAQSSNTEHQLSSEQWQALIALHRTLLHEHHDFFLASQHPAASEALRRLAGRYLMPARMWRHGIHSFLELLRHRLPQSYDQMLTFIYLAYGMMALLYETVSAFEDTWIECLGDLARYRMAIEDNDIKDRETWTAVARSWYSLASEKAPATGRLYHHLAILARPNAVQQLFFYVKSLCVRTAFPSARESIMTLFDPLFGPNPPKLSDVDAAFVRVHAIMFSGKHTDQLDSSMEEYLGLLDSQIGRSSKRWREIGYHTAIPLVCSLLGYGAEDHFMMKIIPKRQDVDMEEAVATEAEPDATFIKARSFMMRTYETAVRRWGDPNTLPFIHTLLTFMRSVSQEPRAMKHLEKEFPWQLTSTMLNYLLNTSTTPSPRVDSKEFPGPLENDTPRPLPEDFAMRGLVYTEDYYPASFFKDCMLEEDEKLIELASMTDTRTERILWLGRRLADAGQWLTWDSEAKQFGVVESYAVVSTDET